MDNLEKTVVGLKKETEEKNDKVDDICTKAKDMEKYILLK